MHHLSNLLAFILLLWHDAHRKKEILAMQDPNPKPTEAEPPLAAEEAPPAKPPRHDDPTRYGDWEIGGRCIDF